MSDDSDSGEISDGAAERLNERDELYRLKGEFISSFAAAEAIMNVSLIAAVGADDPTRRSRVQSLFLSRLSMRNRLDAIWDLVKELGVLERFAPMRSGLNEITALRNEVAHSDLGMTPNWPDAVLDLDRLIKGDYQWASRRWTHRGLRTSFNDRDRLLRALEMIDGLFGDFICLTEAIVAANEGHDPWEAIGRFDAANAHRRGVTDDHDARGPAG